MSPKKKVKVEAGGVDGQMQPLAMIATSVNDSYHVALQDALNIIANRWPNIKDIDALPESGATGHQAMQGFLAPFNIFTYDSMRAASDADGMTYSAGVNFFWQNLMHSPMPWVPLMLENVLAFAAELKPGLLKHNLVFCADFASGVSLPRGGLMRVSPDEFPHAYVFKVAGLISAGATDPELKPWLRTLLSCPATFVRLDTHDARYAEANSSRQDYVGKAALVTHSARQIVYNVHGFKMRKGATMSAEKVAQFWQKEIRTATSHKFMEKQSTIDTCLTLFDRVFSIEDAEKIIVHAEARDGVESAWNSLWKLQEIVYRCQTKGKILWCLQQIDDWLRCKKVGNKEITVASLKTGGKSLSDVALFALRVKAHLLGPWLDQQPYPAYIKEKARLIFDNHASYRLHYNPFCSDDHADTTWLLRWPKVGSDLLAFIEAMVYMISPSDETNYRLAVKNSNTIDEVLSWKQYAEAIANLKTQFNLTGEAGETGTVGGGANVVGAGVTNVSTGAPPSFVQGGTEFLDPDDPANAMKIIMQSSVDRICRTNSFFAVEPTSHPALVDLIKSCPLGTVNSFGDGGNTMILADCNVYGETDAQPKRRSCPIGGPVFKAWHRAVLEARTGKDEPAHLQLGDIFVCIDGGKDRKRVFTRPLLGTKKGKDINRTFIRSIVLHATEASHKTRRERMQGHTKLTQGIQMAMNHGTLKTINACEYPHHKGSNKCDVFGPVDLDAFASLPTLTPADKKLYLGKRLVLAGGKCESESEEDEGDGDDDAAVTDVPPTASGDTQDQPIEDKQLPINFHALPVDVVLDLAKANNCKHVIDFAPTPLPLAHRLISSGISYFGICGTAEQRDYLANQLHDGVMKSLKDPSSTLHDARFLSLNDRSDTADGEQNPSPSAPNPGGPCRPIDRSIFSLYICSSLFPFFNFSFQSFLFFTFIILT